jgi:glycosyltransferase involved in cell wall biosynthesis
VTPHLDFVLPGDPDTRTGGYLYDRRIVSGLCARGWTVDVISLGDGFPFPTEAQRAAAEATLDRLTGTGPVVVDGLAGGVLPEAMARLAARRPLIALVHHPLAEETGLDPATRDRMAASERAGLAHAARVVATGPATAARLTRDYGVSPDRLGVVVPGTDIGPIAPGTGDPPVLLCVAGLSPRKGHIVLIHALAAIADRPWRLVLVGSTTRDPACAAAVRAAIAEAGLGDRVELAGELDADGLAARYAQADLFVLPSLLEGFGMVLTEAVAHGLPIVATTAPAIPDTVPPGSGLLVPPGDAAALAEALAAVLDRPARRAALRKAAIAARDRLAGWDDQAARFEAELRKGGGG